MPTNISTLLINASQQKVWDTLTKPEQVKLWQYGSELLTTWEVGSTIRFRTEWQGTVFEQWGTVVAVQPNELVQYSLFAPAPGREDQPENYFLMSYRLTRQNGQTKLEIIQEDNRPGAAQEDPQGEENPMLKGLKELAESI